MSKVINAKELKVKVSKDYKLFKKLEFNRNLNNKHVIDMQKILEKRGWLTAIICNKSMYIIDGQHTFEAAKKLGLEIPFIQIPNDDVSDIVELNTNQRKWSSFDFLHYWCTLKKEEYLQLQDFIGRWGIPITRGIAFGRLESAGLTETASFKKGEFYFADYDRSEKIARYIAEWQENTKQDNLITSVFGVEQFNKAAMWLISQSQYRHTTMLRQLQAVKVGEITLLPDMVGYRKMLCDIFGKNQPMEKKV